VLITSEVRTVPSVYFFPILLAVSLAILHNAVNRRPSASVAFLG
jgi:hypothetical protein